VTPEDQTPIGQDVLCVSCGYNLRGLSADGDCPECGAAIRGSLRGNLLPFSHPRYIGRLARGASLAYCGYLLIAASIVLGFGWGPWRFLTPLCRVAFYLWAYGVMGVLLGGVWLLTSPDLRESPETPGRRLRIACRVGLPAMLIVPLGAGDWAWWFSPGWLMMAWPIWVAWLSLAWLIAVAWLSLVLAHIARLGDRLPSRSLRRMCHARMAGFMACWVAFVAFWVLTQALSNTPVPPVLFPACLAPTPFYLDQPLIDLLRICQTLAAFVGVIFAALVGFVFARCRSALRAAARHAERHWPDDKTRLETSDPAA